MNKQTPSLVNFVCMEPTTLAILNHEKEKILYEQLPRFEAFCRAGVEQMMSEQQEKIRNLIGLKPKDRYLQLQKERPGLIQRVPQYHLASYLGIKPETLSRIRKKLASKISD